jgi:predicted AAA+ superfamily ATPase
MDPANNYSNRERALMDPSLILAGDAPHAIDEWQEAPGIWDAVRFDVDRSRGTGKYILTGSVTPPRKSYRHSGVGRYAIIRMHPMTLYESGDSTGAVSLAALFDGEKMDPFSADMDLVRLIDIVIRGGWPETLNLPIERAGRISVEYINAVIRNELFGGDFSKRNTTKLRTLLRSIARNNATTVSVRALSTDYDGAARKAQSARETELSRQTVAEYLSDLARIFVIEEIPGWDPEIRSKTMIRMAPKRVFVDPSLAIAALGLDRKRLLGDLHTFGFMFENLCLRDLAAYAGTGGGVLRHYRDNSNLEADAIVEMPDGRWGAFEIKLGEHQVDAAASTLIRMRNKMVGNGARPPSCLAVITGGGYGRLRDDGVYVVPINSMMP